GTDSMTSSSGRRLTTRHRRGLRRPGEPLPSARPPIQAPIREAIVSAPREPLGRVRMVRRQRDREVWERLAAKAIVPSGRLWWLLSARTSRLLTARLVAALAGGCRTNQRRGRLFVGLPQGDGFGLNHLVREGPAHA